MAYHKLKDYDNEIDILDEGIEREGKQGTNISRMITRRTKAIELLLKQREKEQKSKEKSNSNIVDDNSTQKRKRQGRPIFQMDDEMNIIKRFETVSDASKNIGVNSKSIRDAAKGIQKHAGGFVWRYVDEYENG